MNRPYEHSKGMILSNMDEIFRQLYGFIANHQTPAAALYNMLDYDDSYRFSLEDCEFALTYGNRIRRQFITMAIFKHYKGAKIKSTIVKNGLWKDSKDVYTEINDDFLLEKYTAIQNGLFKKRKQLAKIDDK